MPGSGGPARLQRGGLHRQPGRSGDYILRVVNFAAVNPAWTLKAEVYGPGPDVVIGGTKEAWKLTCHSANGVKTQKVYVDRAQRLTVQNPCN